MDKPQRSCRIFVLPILASLCTYLLLVLAGWMALARYGSLCSDYFPSDLTVFIDRSPAFQINFWYTSIFILILIPINQATLFRWTWAVWALTYSASFLLFVIISVTTDNFCNLHWCRPRLRDRIDYIVCRRYISEHISDVPLPDLPNPLN